MTDEKITPALTAEEWEMRFVDWGTFYSHTGVRLNPHGGITVYNDGDVNDVATHQLPALIALANHALPDTHPLKITRADVETINEALTVGTRKREDIDEALQRVATKLSLLLPTPPADG